MLNIEETNRRLYAEERSLHAYAKAQGLTPPEERLLTSLDLSTMDVLDIGIGGGRTTAFLLPRVRRYVGIDYVEDMIMFCRGRFPSAPNVKFEMCDVTAMKIFQDNLFDCVFFSYNGLDSLSHEHRLRALAEIRRVAKPSAVFIFSSHNLYAISRLFRVHVTRNLPRLLRSFFLKMRVRFSNPPARVLLQQEHAMIHESHIFGLYNYYIKPEAMIAQLETHGFQDVSVYGKDGTVIAPSAFSMNEDGWLYYRCVVKK